MRARSLIPFIPYIVVATAHVVLAFMDHPLGGFATKQLLTATLALAAVWALARVRPWPRSAMLLLLVGLAASWVGDGAGLLFPGLPTLPMMILFFAIVHIAYITIFWRGQYSRGVRMLGVRAPGDGLAPKWAWIYAVWWVVAISIIGPHSGSLFIPLAIYGVVLGGTAALSTRLGTTVAVGGAFFLVSDTLIAVREFMSVPSWVDELVMPTYELGQGLIVYGVVQVLLRTGRSLADRPTDSESDQATVRNDGFDVRGGVRAEQGAQQRPRSVKAWV